MAAAATSITPVNVDGFATNDIIFLGNFGIDQVEKLEITVAGENLTVPALQFQHNRFEPITDVLGDQIQFYSAADPGTGYAPPNSAFTPLGSPVSIDPTTLVTDYVDLDGGSGFWYSYVYWNSIQNTAVTFLSDVQPSRGGDLGLYIDVDAVRGEAGFNNNKNITDPFIATFIAKACDYVNSRLAGYYSLPFQDPVPQTVQDITKQYAAGLLLKQQYGVFGAGSEADGSGKITDADVTLTELTSSQAELYDQAGKSLRIFAPVAGWPNATTASTPGFDDDGNPQFGGLGMDSDPLLPKTKVY